MSSSSSEQPILGVVVVAFQSGEIIVECLESLAASVDARLKVVVVDNASSDNTCDAVRQWASGALPFVRPNGSPLADAPPTPKPLPLTVLEDHEGQVALGPFTLLRSSINRGFAGGVNLGLKALAGQADWIWVLNPDCVVPPHTAKAYIDAAQAHPRFSLMTSRTIYYDQPNAIQTDGGEIDRRTGVGRQHGVGRDPAVTSAPSGEDLDWVTGANMVASAAFLSRAGLMREDYFLYYEEVDWAFRRGDLPLSVAPAAYVYHRGGTTIGTGALDRRPSAFANYFNHRNRIRFTKRFLSRGAVLAYLYGIAKAVQLALKGAWDEAYAIIAGMFELPPPRAIRQRFPDPEVARLAFGRETT